MVGGAHVGQEQRTHRGLVHAQRVEVIVLAAHVGAHADDVVFVGGHQRGLELLEETTDRRVLLAALTADFHREHHVATVVEAERDHRVGDRLAAPVRQHGVGAGEVVQVVAAGFPMRVVVGVAAPGEVAHVVQHHLVALDAAGERARDIVGPVAQIGWRNAAPPEQQQRVQRQVDARRKPAAATDRDAGQHDHHQRPGHAAQGPHHGAARQLVPQGQRAPRARAQRGQGEQANQQHPRDHPDSLLHHVSGQRSMAPACGFGHGKAIRARLAATLGR